MRLGRPRFTILRLMAVVALVAVFRWLLRQPDGMPFAVALGGGVLALTCWAVVRGRCRPAAVSFGASVVVANGLVAPLCVYCHGSGWPGVYVGLFCGIPMALGFGIAWAVAATRRDTPRARSPRVLRAPLFVLLLAVSAAVTPLITLWTLWPLRVAFLVSSPALERLADRVAAGQAPPFPIRAGLYRIVGCATDPCTGNIALITDANPGGREGFVRYQLGTPHGPFSSLWMGMNLSRRWAFEMEE
jgi:hypothetical protein